MRCANLLLFCSLAACAAEPAFDQPVEGDDPWKTSAREALSESGRWAPSAEARAASSSQTVRYDGAPAWSGGSSCTGTFTDGARELGDYLTASFGGASRYDGYACRQNTADTSRTSMHGTGRAIDLFVPLDGGDADNGLGDPIADWLVTHGEEIGVQLVIWDRTIWNGSRSGEKDRAYGGPHPHHDHLHIELNEDGAARLTAWFGGSRSAPPAEEPPASEEPPTSEEPPAEEPPADMTPSEPGPGSTSSAVCTNECWYAYDGECDDGGDGALWDLCELGSDCADCGVREEPSW